MFSMLRRRAGWATAAAVKEGQRTDAPHPCTSCRCLAIVTPLHSCTPGAVERDFAAARRPRRYSGQLQDRRGAQARVHADVRHPAGEAGQLLLHLAQRAAPHARHRALRVREQPVQQRGLLARQPGGAARLRKPRWRRQRLKVFYQRCKVLAVSPAEQR